MTAEELTRRKEVILALMTDPLYRPMRLREIAVFLDIPKEKREDLAQVLDALTAEGKIRVSNRGKYSRPEKHSVIGVFRANPKGYGFVSPEDAGQDLFIPREHTHGAMDGATVRISVEPGQRYHRTEGVVLEVLKRANPEIVGYYRRVQNFGLVVPDNQRITDDVYIPPGKAMGAVTGHKVVVRITSFPTHREEEPIGEVKEIIGHISEPGTDILSIAKAYALPDHFPDEVLSDAARVSENGITPEEEALRTDYRDLLTVTIDGEDAKDLDDAVSLKEKPDGGYTLYVHIADVSWYVREGSALDREALKRGTSVYLSDRVLPMLPPALSNGACSLNEGEEKLTLTCRMEIDPEGRIRDHAVEPSIIRSDARLTYTKVDRLLTAHDNSGLSADSPVGKMLLSMGRLSGILRRRREERGAMAFDFPESRVILDDRGRPTGVEQRERNDATRMIEDFMLAANETVAEDYYWRKIPFLYRVHDQPDPEKMRALSVFVNRFGLTLKVRSGEIRPADLQALLKKAAGNPAEDVIERVALRSMKKAEYRDVCGSHFGLAARYYTHFTSPIRRYPDLQIHRIIREVLAGKMTGKRAEHYEAILGETAARCSMTERRAEEAERDCLRYKLCEYMEDHVGEVFEGIISGVTRYGFYVTLPNSAEGMVRLQSLGDDYYEFSEEDWALVGELTGRRYVLGQKLKVRVIGADRLSRTIDLEPF